MPQNPIDTGELTKAGRKVWIDPQTKERYSERTVTIPVDIGKDGNPLPNTRWVNVPSVFDGGKVIDDEDFLIDFYKKNNFKDPLTNRKLDFYGSTKEAVDAAVKRSSELLD
jgi:hypothetical protein